MQSIQSTYSIHNTKSVAEITYFSVSFSVNMTKPSPVLAGDELSVTCTIDRTGFDLIKPTVRWIGPDDSTYKGVSKMNTNTLTVSKVIGIHNGKWTCEVSNNYPNSAILKARTDAIIVGMYRINETLQHCFSCSYKRHCQYHALSFETDVTLNTHMVKVCGHQHTSSSTI